MGALWTTRAQQCTGTAGVAGSNHDLQSTVGFFQKTLIIQKILFIQKGTGGGGRAPAAPGAPPTPTSAGCTPWRPSPALAARCGGALLQPSSASSAVLWSGSMWGLPTPFTPFL